MSLFEGDLKVDVSYLKEIVPPGIICEPLWQNQALVEEMI
jgi:hypothetical protein